MEATSFRQGAMGTWSPSHEVLQNTGNLLLVLRDPTNPQFHEAQSHLESYRQDPAFLLSLAYILAQTSHQQVADDVRQLAGLLLKNYVMSNPQVFLQPNADKSIAEMRDYVKSQALVAARDCNEGVRNIAGILITTVATNTIKARMSIGTAWPELFPLLIEMLSSGQVAAIEGAFSSLLKILEDCGNDIRADVSYGQGMINQLAGIFPSFFTSENPKIRASAVQAMNLLVPLKPTQLTVNMDAFIQALAMLKDDSCALVRQGVCQALVALFRDGSDHLLSKLPEIMNFMLSKSQDENEQVSRDACEFWNVFINYYGHEDSHKVLLDMLQAFLPRLVPVLLKGMVYSQSDREMLEADNKFMHDSVPDRAEDLKPLHYHSRAGGSDGVEQEEEEDEEDEEGMLGAVSSSEDEVEQWNLRRCSAATLDTMAEFFGPSVLLPILLPLLYDGLQHNSLWEREAAILALGAVASCVQGMSEQLPQLFPFLLQQLDDKTGLELNPQLGCTVVWTLSRYGCWVLEQENDSVYLSPLVERLLRAMMNHNKKVQQAACSAFATLEEDAGRRILPYLSHVLPVMAEAMERRYQTRSLIVLFDTLGTLADSVRQELATSEYIAVFMPPLWKKWKQFQDHDRVLLYLLECLTSLVQALGVAFQPWASEVYQRCLSIIAAMLIAEQAQQQESKNKDFAVCALDLLTGMAEGLGPSFESLLPASELLSLLYGCMKDASEEIRQSAFALVGDLAKGCHRHLLPVLADYMPVLIENLNPRFLSVCNNSSWAIGEITVHVGPATMGPYVPHIIAKLEPILNAYEQVNPNLLENTAITVGRLAKVCPEVLAPGMTPKFLHAWCLSLQNVKHRGEKEHAFEGLCLVLQQNPGVLLSQQETGRAASFSHNTFESFAWAVASWYDTERCAPDVPEGLNHMFKVILHYVRDVVKTQRDWNEYLSSLDPHLVQYFVTFYEL